MTQRQPVIFVVDDDVLVRDRVKGLVRSVGCEARGFASAEEFLSSEHPEAPRCLVLDIRLPGASGLDLQRHLLQENIRIPIVFITGYGDIRMSVEAMKAGAIDFLTKPFRDQDLLDAIQQAIECDRIARRQQSENAELQKRFDRLTSRERQVLALLVQGFVNKQIGHALRITEPTVKLHRSRLMHKLGADSVATLVWMFGKLGLAGGKQLSPNALSERSLTTHG